MNAVNKHNQQPPLNPFRTRGEDSQKALFVNPVVQACYFVSVGALIVAVAVVAWTTISQLPIPLEVNTAYAASPHRIAVVADLPEIKSRTKQSPPRIGGGVRSQARIPAPQLSDKTGTLLEKTNLVKPVLLVGKEWSKDFGEDDSRKEDQLPVHHNDEDENTSIVHDRDEPLLPASGAAMKILGETKEQVRQEIEREEYGEHAFGLPQEDTAAVANLEAKKQNADPKPEVDTSGDGKGEGTRKDDIDRSQEVHVIRRKGGSATTSLSALLVVDEEPTFVLDKGVVNVTTSRLQSIIEISANNELAADQHGDGQRTEGEDDRQQEQQARLGRSSPISAHSEVKQEQRQSHKKQPPKSVTANE